MSSSSSSPSSSPSSSSSSSSSPPPSSSSMIDRVLVSVERISSITPVPGDELYVILTILGWTTVVRSNLPYAVDDLVLYYRNDACLPPAHPLYSIYRGHPLEATLICGIVSHGRVGPLSESEWHNVAASLLIDGSDMTLLFNVRLEVSHAAKKNILHDEQGGSLDWCIPKSRVTRMQDKPSMITDMIGHDVIATRKEDGASCTYAVNTIDGKRVFRIFSRNCNITDVKPNAGSKHYYDIENEHNIKQKLMACGINVAIQGEACGPKINGNRHFLEAYRFRVFSVFSIDDASSASSPPSPWCYSRSESFVSSLGLEMVPVLHRWSSFTHANASLNFLLDAADAVRYGRKGVATGSHLGEGMVLTVDHAEDNCTTGSVKVLSNAYLIEYQCNRPMSHREAVTIIKSSSSAHASSPSSSSSPSVSSASASVSSVLSSSSSSAPASMSKRAHVSVSKSPVAAAASASPLVIKSKSSPAAVVPAPTPRHAVRKSSSAAVGRIASSAPVAAVAASMSAAVSAPAPAPAPKHVSMNVAANASASSSVSAASSASVASSAASNNQPQRDQPRRPPMKSQVSSLIGAIAGVSLSAVSFTSSSSSSSKQQPIVAIAASHPNQNPPPHIMNASMSAVSAAAAASANADAKAHAERSENGRAAARERAKAKARASANADAESRAAHDAVLHSHAAAADAVRAMDVQAAARAAADADAKTMEDAQLYAKAKSSAKTARRRMQRKQQRARIVNEVNNQNE